MLRGDAHVADDRLPAEHARADRDAVRKLGLRCHRRPLFRTPSRARGARLTLRRYAATSSAARAGIGANAAMTVAIAAMQPE